MEHEFAGWEVIEKLGEGGMCAVYRARRDDQERAIKVLLEGGPYDRFVEEARILSTILHPHVVRVDHLQTEDPPWMVMELLTGRDLEHHRDHQPVSPEQAARWIANVADGLQAVHDAGLVHRDLKPSNVMLGSDGSVRLIDFGIAREREAPHQTGQGIVMGTASYLAPELFTSKDANLLQDAPVAEVFSLGQTLCELITGLPVHPDGDEGSVSVARLMADKVGRGQLDPREWAACPTGLAAVVMDATEGEPDERIQTAAELSRRLRQWLDERERTESAPVSMLSTLSALPAPPDAPVTSTPASHPPRLWMGAAGVGIGLNLAVVVLTATLVLGLWWLRPQQSPLQQAIHADSRRITNCVTRPATFDVHNGKPQGLEPDEALCIEVLGWPRGEATVELY